MINAIHSRSFAPTEKLPLEPGTYLYGQLEERSSHMDVAEYPHVRFLKIEESEDGLAFGWDKTGFLPKLASSFLRLLDAVPAGKLYLDITGLSHSIWAPILKFLIERKLDFLVIYVEPDDYSRTFSIDHGRIYDLSEKVRGMSPIPTFASFLGDEENFVFVPMLGFEGARFLYFLDLIDPIGDYVFPVIGVPGFCIEYPFFAYQANQLGLNKTKAWKRIIFASADCPFALFYEMERVALENSGLSMRIGLTGTKPHSLGAVLYRLVHPEKTELLYDHPIRKQKRTSGIRQKHIYDVLSFLDGSEDTRTILKGGRLR